MLLGALLAGLTLALAAEDIITHPSPGNEYVSLAIGPHTGRRLSHHDMKVYVKDEGTTGYKRSEKTHPKKAETLPEKKEPIHQLKASVKDEGAVGAHLRDSQGVPPLKHISFSSQPAKIEKRDDSPDFDDDSSIIPAASSQNSRINVKKGPNGQEYEYEYVYYYYDDEDEDGKTKSDPKAAKGTAKPAVEEPIKAAKQDEDDAEQEPRQELKSESRQDQRNELRGKSESRQEHRTEPRQDLRGEGRHEQRNEGRQDVRNEGRQDLRQDYRQDYRHENKAELRTQEVRQDDRQSLRDEPQRHRGSNEPRYQLEREEEEEEEIPVRQRGGDRYEDRTRQQPAESRHRGEAQEGGRRGRPTQPPTEEIPSRNRYTTIERGRGKGTDIAAVTTAEPSSNEVLPTRSSSRSRGQPIESVEDERLPANTRFPSRQRGSPAEPARALDQPQPTRSRGSTQGGSVRRPSLVDSSSFRTHGADAPLEEDKQGYLSSQLDTRESDFEEYLRPTTFLPPATTLPPAPPQPQNQEMPQKAAIDLYAILQQTQEENSVLEPELRTTDPPTTEPPTTTTEPTTTTTTTTTTTPPPTTQPPTQRGRFRSGNTRSRVRTHSTTTTTETPEEEAPKREKFKPSHNRNPGQVSAYGRRRSGSTTTQPPSTDAPAPKARPGSFGGSSGNRYRTRGRVSTTAAPQEEEHSEETEPSSTTSKPARVRLSAGARPLRPGPRLNLRPKQASSTTPAAVEVPAEEPTTPEPVQHSEGDSLTKLRSRPRLKVQPAPPQPRPFSATNRRPLPGLRRRTTEAEVEAEATTASVNAGETEPPAPLSSTEPPQPQPTESKLSSLISRRRPLPRRVHVQPPADQ